MLAPPVTVVDALAVVVVDEAFEVVAEVEVVAELVVLAEDVELELLAVPGRHWE